MLLKAAKVLYRILCTLLPITLSGHRRCFLARRRRLCRILGSCFCSSATFPGTSRWDWNRLLVRGSHPKLCPKLFKNDTLHFFNALGRPPFDTIHEPLLAFRMLFASKAGLGFL